MSRVFSPKARLIALAARHRLRFSFNILINGSAAWWMEPRSREGNEMSHCGGGGVAPLAPFRQRSGAARLRPPPPLQHVFNRALGTGELVRIAGAQYYIAIGPALSAAHQYRAWRAQRGKKGSGGIT